MSRPVRQRANVVVALAAAALLTACGLVEPTDTAGPASSAGPAPTQQGNGPGDTLPSASATSASEHDDDASADDTQDDDTQDDDRSELPSLGSPGIPECDVLDLPATTLETIDDIEAGGPYDHPRNDGVRFQNREGILPDEDRDYYREFTVETPGLDHRGARRIVTGSFEQTDPEHWYYTGDHYESFCEFAPN
ncbi:ribonuclease domain-containing protein [Ornithinimicrobium cryptoxanthini]|uniref:ribonuclease domain-containing protein n=1 Tax=Ornithinimicrobium cryptoxanthini TaxID=2934161 RepID=UPI0021193F47|nr:ribonuclease domain-containing protein [Ornithinimicrobium cryptoxanthini]